MYFIKKGQSKTLRHVFKMIEKLEDNNSKLFYYHSYILIICTHWFCSVVNNCRMWAKWKLPRWSDSACRISKGFGFPCIITSFAKRKPVCFLRVAVKNFQRVPRFPVELSAKHIKPVNGLSYGEHRITMLLFLAGSTVAACNNPQACEFFLVECFSKRRNVSRKAEMFPNMLTHTHTHTRAFSPSPCRSHSLS